MVFQSSSRAPGVGSTSSQGACASMTPLNPSTSLRAINSHDNPILQMATLRQREMKGLAKDHMAGRGSLVPTFHALSTTLTCRCFPDTHSTPELPSLTVHFPPLLPPIPAATEAAFCALCRLSGREGSEENRISWPYLFAGARCTLGC